MVQGTDFRMTCTFSEDPAWSGARRTRTTLQGDWRLTVLSGLYTREFNEICSVHPVFKAHLRCAFLIMSGGYHVNTSLSQMHCLRNGAGDHARH